MRQWSSAYRFLQLSTSRSQGITISPIQGILRYVGYFRDNVVQIPSLTYKHWLEIMQKSFPKPNKLTLRLKIIYFETEDLHFYIKMSSYGRFKHT